MQRALNHLVADSASRLNSALVGNDANKSNIWVSSLNGSPFWVFSSPFLALPICCFKSFGGSQVSGRFSLVTA
jgi:hypothetical protein